MRTYRTYPAVGDRVLVHGVGYHKAALAGLVTEESDGFIQIRVFHPTTPWLDETVKLHSYQRDNHDGVNWTFAGDY